MGTADFCALKISTDCPPYFSKNQGGFGSPVPLKQFLEEGRHFSHFEEILINALAGKDKHHIFCKSKYELFKDVKLLTKT